TFSLSIIRWYLSAKRVWSSDVCSAYLKYRINISGTGIRELLRYGILPPKESVRPESARIAIQGVQTKGTDEKDEAMRPVGKTIRSLFPFYMNACRLGGEPGSGEQVEPEELSLRDLRSVMLDVRGNADKIYSDISESFTFNADTNRTLQPDWRVEARTIMRRQQEMVIADLEEKV